MKNIFFYLLVILISKNSYCQNQLASREDGILISSTTKERIDSTKIYSAAAAIQKGIYPNIHSMLIARNNKLVYENYWSGKDEIWGTDIGVVRHSADSLHDIRSISKSIVSACTGIAIAQGKIKSVDEKIFDFFPEYSKLDTGLKSSLTIKDLLTMTSGLSWNEEVPYDDPRNSEVRMARSSNVVEFVLSQPMDFPPGKVWKYNGGTTQLLAAIIQKTTGKRIDEFAKEYLFKPLGITNFQWTKYPGTDLPAAASGLRMQSRDLLKFGLLYMNNGVWQGKPILPAKWVEESLQSYVKRGDDGGYGYQFWIWNDTVKNKPMRFVAAVGNGDQRIYFDKLHNMVIIFTAGNYNKWDIKMSTNAVLKDFIYPALTGE